MNADDMMHPRIRIVLLTSKVETAAFPENYGASSGLEVKLVAAMRPTAIAPLNSVNLLQALMKYPIVLFLSLPRIWYHAWILHYLKHLPIHPRPEPLPLSHSSTGPDIPERGSGIGWQPETYLQRFAKARVLHFLEKRVQEIGISVELVSGDPSVPPIRFACSDTSYRDGEGQETLYITYLSSSFFTLLFEAPSAQHALAFNRAEALFSSTSADLFLRVFCTKLRSMGKLTYDPRDIGLAQRLRCHAIPSTLCIHPDLQHVPSRHPIDPGQSLSPVYILTIAYLLVSLWLAYLEKELYRLFNVRFVPGEEPWRRWEQVGDYLRSHNLST